MRRPNLVNGGWSPFRSIPIPVHVLESIPESISEPYRPSRRELIQQNSFFLNIMAFLVLGSILYFLYQVYLERKVISQYLELVRNDKEQQDSGFF